MEIDGKKEGISERFKRDAEREREREREGDLGWKEGGN